MTRKYIYTLPTSDLIERLEQYGREAKLPKDVRCMIDTLKLRQIEANEIPEGFGSEPETETQELNSNMNVLLRLRAYITGIIECADMMLDCTNKSIAKLEDLIDS